MIKFRHFFLLIFAAIAMLQVNAQGFPVDDFDSGTIDPFYSWGAPLTIEANPDGTPEDSVALLDQSGGAWNGIAKWTDDGTFFLNVDSLTVDVYANAEGSIKFFADNSISGAANFEKIIDGVPAKTWTTYTVYASDLPGTDYKQFAIQYSIADSIFFDNFTIYGSTVVDIIVNSDDHTTLETAVIEAELDDDLSGPGPFTVFAPTDAAFAALPDGVLDDLLLDPTGELANILLYHVVSGKVMSTDLSDGQIATTLLGKDIEVTITGDGVFINDAKVTTADVEAYNGVVHVIDAVLTPPTTVVDVIVNSDDHTTLETAVIAAELADDLNKTGPFTVFAPTDAAFDLIDPAVLQALLDDPTGDLASILLYHVVAGEALSTDLSDGQVIETLFGQNIRVSITGEGVFINDAKVSTADIDADNGVVHVLDAVLLPELRDVVGIIVDSEDHTTLETAVVAAGLVETLQGEGPFTVFAPTDAAFDALDPALLQALLDDPTGDLTSILLYHVVAGKALSTDLSDGQVIETVLGQNITVTITGEGVFINDAQVTVADLEATNGVVHVIDAVLIPELRDVVDIIVDSEDHTTLETAVVEAGLVETLQGEGPFTVFAPTDAAFDAVDPDFLQDLLDDPTGDLTDVLLYHVVAGKAMSTDLSDGQVIETVLGQDITVTITGDGVFINNAQVTVADIEATNGVIHVIDAVLVPELTPATVVDIIVDSDDHTTLETAVLATADAVLIENFETENTPAISSFGGIESAPNEVIENPDKSGLNVSDSVVKFVKVSGSQTWAGAYFDPDPALLDFDTYSQVRMLSWSPKAGINVRFKIENEGNSISHEVDVVTTVANEWEELVFDMSGAPEADYVRVVVFFDRGSTGDDSEYYYDDIRLGHMNLVETLQGEGPFTVFAPTDAAFDLLPEGTLDDLLADPGGALTDILLYHVAAGKVMSTDLSDGQVIETVLGKDITVSITGDGVFINDAQVTLADLEADNGVVHVLDAVLIPPLPKTVVDIIVESEDHTTLEAAVLATGMEELVEDFETENTPQIISFGGIESAPNEVIENPDKSGLNVSDSVVKFVKVSGSQTWAGAFFDPDPAILDFDTYTEVRMLSWAPKAGINVRFKIENEGNSISHEVTIQNTVANEWEELVFDMSEAPEADYVRVVVFYDQGSSGDDSEYYYDNIRVASGGLATTLMGEGPFTVFAPTDAAFDALDEGVLDELLADPAGDLTDILLYHVVNAKALSTDLSDGQVIETALGQDITVSITGDGVFINDAQVTVADIEAQNGVVHVIDAVLMPELMPETVVDIIVDSPDHETLEAAVIAADLVETLQGEGPFTVFAPTDAAFDLLPEGKLDELLADPSGELTNILLYHVVAGKAMSTDLSDGQTITTQLGEDVTVAITGDGVFINGAQVTVADLEAKNGVVHVIDAVLLPPTNVEEQQAGDMFRVFPNPATDIVTLQINGAENFTGGSLEIIRIDGVIVNRIDINSFTTTIDINGYDSGVYYLRYSEDDKYAIKKLVIK